MRKPDWDFWLHLPRVQVWQACALSLNIDPDSMKHSPWIDGYIVDSAATQDTYDKRMRLTCANLGTAGHFRLDHPVPNPKCCEIYLSDFAKWGVNVMHWKDVPAELIGIVQAASAAGETEVARSVPTAEGPVPHIVAPFKVTRSNILDGVIRTAQEASKDQDDYQQVWAELVRMADSKERPAPLLGYVEGEGVKYQGKAGIKFLTKAALRGRFNRRGK